MSLFTAKTAAYLITLLKGLEVDAFAVDKLEVRAAGGDDTSPCDARDFRDIRLGSEEYQQGYTHGSTLTHNRTAVLAKRAG